MALFFCCEHMKYSTEEGLFLCHVHRASVTEEVIKYSGFTMPHYIYTYIHTQSGPKKCIHSLLINIFGINLNEISISGESVI